MPSDEWAEKFKVGEGALNVELLNLNRDNRRPQPFLMHPQHSYEAGCPLC